MLAEVLVEIICNGRPRPTDPGSTVAELLVALELADRPVAVEVNRAVVPRFQHAVHRLQAGDHVEIVTLVGGG